MGYATIADVEVYVPSRAPFGTSTVPNATAVGVLIEDATTQVDEALILGGYALPVPTTATIAYRIVQGACAKGAAAMVEKVAPTNGSGKTSSTQAMFDSALKMMRDGQLPDLDRDSAESAPRSGFDPGATAFFSRDMVL